jgi:hypothetical protein
MVMFNTVFILLKAIFMRGAAPLAIVLALATSFEAKADSHYFSLKKIFPNGKCSPVIPNYELMVAGFAGGESTKLKIYDNQGNVVEVISTFFNKTGDQWVIVGSKTKSKVIFCLYSSGNGKGSVDRQIIN